MRCKRTNLTQACTVGLQSATLLYQLQRDTFGQLPGCSVFKQRMEELVKELHVQLSNLSLQKRMLHQDRMQDKYTKPAFPPSPQDMKQSSVPDLLTWQFPASAISMELTHKTFKSTSLLLQQEMHFLACSTRHRPLRFSNRGNLRDLQRVQEKPATNRKSTYQNPSELQLRAHLPRLPPPKSLLAMLPQPIAWNQYSDCHKFLSSLWLTESHWYSSKHPRALGIHYAARKISHGGSLSVHRSFVNARRWNILKRGLVITAWNANGLAGKQKLNKSSSLLTRSPMCCWSGNAS